MAKLTIKDLAGKLRDKKVLIRVDFNVPLEAGTRKITDDRRIKSSVQTIEYVRKEGGIPVLMSHLGRPKGEWKEEYSLKPVAERLGELLRTGVQFVTDCVGPEAEKVVSEAQSGDTLLLENVRFHKGETKNEPEFAASLANHGEFYINDAFATAHRAHASNAGVASHFKGRAAAGFLLEKELKLMGGALEDPKHPFVAIIGGAKISGKIDVIQNLLSKVDTLLIGGGMSYTFYKAMGLEVGKSILEEDKISLASDLLQDLKNHPGLKFYLPMDCVIAQEVSEEAKTQVVTRDKIPPGMQGLDIGPETSELYAGIVEKAKLVVWNGPMGVFEKKPFAVGTNAIAEALAKATSGGATTIIGGGDSASAIDKAGLSGKVTHVSTGGGASLDLLGGKTLPGVEALSER